MQSDGALGRAYRHHSPEFRRRPMVDDESCWGLRILGQLHLEVMRCERSVAAIQAQFMVNLATNEVHFSRISKLFVDRDDVDLQEAFVRRQQYAVALVCGPDVQHSYTLQLAVITAAKIATRCFPGTVRVLLASKIAQSPLLISPWLNRSLGAEFGEIKNVEVLTDVSHCEQHGRAVLFGNARGVGRALRATFDGWTAIVGPADHVERQAERELCALAGVLSASLAVSELFLAFAGINIEAGRRVVGLSLWRPDLPASDPIALGVPVEFLPSALWLLGLGHLGNAYLWSLANMPYADPAAAEIFLDDADKVEPENEETGLLFSRSDRDFLKTRVCGDWLERRGFRTRLIERYIDSEFRCRLDEPQLALCGFDSNPARRDLQTAKFRRVVESGLGGTASNFDTISMHTLPNPRSPEELWPDLSQAETMKEAEKQERLATKSAYSNLAADRCGRTLLAGKAVAVPFVGTTAATFVVAEVLRLLHGGPAYTDIKFSLTSPAELHAVSGPTYNAGDLAGISFCLAHRLQRA
jgi:hypothetical protein